ncbi:sugar ABC transporter substrate-binding protein [Conexibacter stalactiti]|uniref:Sugar ABC transporter substrate-binding protein n=1 Tax=Conexibacter stalactiti TaxID=1940611 RepID=A0ABU4HVQ9_9ACTN|nr:sugar ABC transporter substrate-binding protein [Conexibacter stalactiti]MDW5597417.1 sugar ABC transporter substrate-binding protein [Conexibacter stalactiti]MEC5038059.1 sugar ABC transporter substrate-binding protein [Conexibacter stalactiti]
MSSRTQSGSRVLRALTAVFAALAAAGALAACGSSTSDESGGGGSASGGVTFGFSQPYAEVPIVAAIKKQVKAIGEADGWEVLLDETQAGELQDQLAVLDTWITQRVTAMNVAAFDPSAYEATARRAVDAGIVWTTYGGRMEEGAGGVLFPPELSGEVTGRAAVEWINANDPDAEVIVLEIPTGGPQRARTDIPQRMIREQTRARIVAVQGAIEQSKGLQVTEDVLQAHPGVTVVIGHNDDGALGAAEAFRKVGKQSRERVWIVGQDGSEDALATLRRGDTFFKASAALDIQRLCEEVVGVSKRAIERAWRSGDRQEYVELAPTLLSVGDTELIDRFLATYGK